MIPRIIAFTMILCLSLGTFSLANQKSTSNLPTLKWERSIKTRMYLGIGLGLAGSIVAATNKEKDIKGDNAALGVALVGFGYAFFNWMKLHPPSGTGFTYTSPGTYAPQPRIYTPPPRKTRVKCAVCGGTGLRRCSICGGRGGRYSGEGIFRRWWNCVNCNGMGLVTCYLCGGLGYREY